jgi:hypothetical protein
LSENPESDSNTGVLCKWVFYSLCHSKCSIANDSEGSEKQKHSDETKLLCNYRKDEISLYLRKISELLN